MAGTQSSNRDLCPATDHLVAIQVVDGKTYLPRRPEVAIGLAPARRAGTWHLLRADDFLSPLAHVRFGAAQRCH
jgi:hypothetical protein